MIFHRPLAATALALACALAPAAARAQVAVIVNPHNPVAAMSADELRRYFLGQTTSFGRPGPVMIVESVPSRRVFCTKALKSTEARFRREWVAIVFRGGAIEIPRQIADPAEVTRFVAQHPNALAFVEASAVDNTVKVVAIDGKRPSDPGYLIR